MIITKELILPIIIALLSGGGLMGFLQFMIKRDDDRREQKIEKKLNEIEKKMDTKFDELDNRIMSVNHACTRTQLMILMKLFPDRKEEIIKVAYRYFVELNGNFYMSELFKHWLNDNNIIRPDWFTDTI